MPTRKQPQSRSATGPSGSVPSTWTRRAVLRSLAQGLAAATLLPLVTDTRFAEARAQGSVTPRAYLPFVAYPGSPWVAHVTLEFSHTVRPGSESRDLAVVLHSITFLDALGCALGSLQMGTAEANAQQGLGWFANETWPEIGSAQWAGGPARVAEVSLVLMPGTVGLLLDLGSVDDAMWMQVKVDGTLRAAVPVQTRWHQAYVPLTPPLDVPAAGAGLQWHAGRYFPSLTMPSLLYSVHVDTAMNDWWGAPSSPDWRINSDLRTMLGLTLVGMQGVINRHTAAVRGEVGGAAVFLDWDAAETQFSPNKYWLSLLRQQVQVIALDLDGISAFHFLWQRYAGRFRGGVLYDPQVPDTINLATMYAGLEDRVILAPEQLVLADMPSFASLVDLRTLVQEEHWDATEAGKYRLYAWVYDNLWPRLDHRVVGVYSPGPPTSRNVGVGTGQYFPLGLGARDHLVALRSAVLWLSPLEEPQASLFARFVQDAPAPAVVYGFFANDELGTVALASRLGGWCPVVTNGNSPLGSRNLTVLGAVRSPPRKSVIEIRPERLLATLDARSVVTFWTSDGDSMQFLLDRGFHGTCDLNWIGVQGHRLGWTINPILSELAPVAWNDYMTSASEVAFVGGLSGAGYAYPALMSDVQLGQYLGRAANYLQDTGLRVLHVDDRFGAGVTGLSAPILNRYYQELRDTGYLGSFIGCSGWPWGMGFYYVAAPSPAVLPSYVLWSSNGEGIVRHMLSRQPGIFRVELGAVLDWQSPDARYGWHSGQLVDDPAAHLGRSLRFSRQGGTSPGLVLWGPFAALMPGTYDLTYRLKVADNRETSPIARLFVGAGETEWRQFGQRPVAPSDFRQASQYQEMAFSFQLDQPRANVEFRMDYLGGQPGGATTDLFADEVIATWRGQRDLPVAAGVFIPPDQVTNPSRFRLIEDLQRAGALVLTPDEFMAMLNPEYMIEFATPRLGENHPALVQAREHLRNGRFLDSLLAVRAALRDVIGQAQDP